MDDILFKNCTWKVLFIEKNWTKEQNKKLQE
jgi:hypothetical protein